MSGAKGGPVNGPVNGPVSGAPTRHWRAEPARDLGGTLSLPGDKSISHRALLFGGIAAGRTDVSGFLASEDCLATLRALRALGVHIEQPAATQVIVHGAGMHALRRASEPLDMGNAGTAMRLFMGLLAGQPFDSTLVGDASLMRRPMERAAAPLRQMGARIDTQGGRPPVIIHGGNALRGIDYTLPVASAQVKSAVLIAGLHALGTTRVVEPAPSRDHTERMLGGFGVRLRREGRTVSLDGGQTLRGTRIQVPADFSSAAFFIVAAAIGGGDGLTLTGVGMNPTRTGLLEILRLMGADISVGALRDAGGEPVADLRIRPSRLRGIAVPPELVPLAIDEFPVFFIAAACAQGESLLRGAEELRVKESDRLASMASGLAALGVQHELLADGMRIEGRPLGAAFGAGHIDSHGDHRIAMAFAVASLRASGSIEIADTANVATSFPGFLELARSAGLQLTER